MDQITSALKEEGYDFGIAIATQAEIDAMFRQAGIPPP